MNTEEESDITALTSFLTQNDPNGARHLLHSLPIERVRALHKHYGVGHPYHKFIEDRYKLLLAEAASQQSDKKTDGDPWYKKPVGIIVISLSGGILLLLVRAAMTHQFPQWIK